MKKLLLLILPMLLASCEPASVRQGRKVYEAYFHYILKDPESFVVYDEDYTMEGKSTIKWELDYGGRNSFGGNVRETAEFTTCGDMIFIDGWHYSLGELQ